MLRKWLSLNVELLNHVIEKDGHCFCISLKVSHLFRRSDFKPRILCFSLRGPFYGVERRHSLHPQRTMNGERRGSSRAYTSVYACSHCCWCVCLRLIVAHCHLVVRVMSCMANPFLTHVVSPCREGGPGRKWPHQLRRVRYHDAQM